MDTIELPDELRAQLAALDVVADRIRLLDRRGYARADIARILGKRYQHVRNVLERDAAAAAPETPGGAQDVPGPDAVLRIEVAADGTLRLPPGVLRGLEVPRGGVLSARLVEGRLTLVAPLVALRRAQRIAQKYKVEGRSVVDEFLAERRALWGDG